MPDQASPSPEGHAGGDRRPSTSKEKEAFSSGGQRHFDPHWVYNLRADGNAWIRVARRNRPVRAWVSQGEERERIYQELCRQGRSTVMYQKMCARRELPLVVLRDRSATA